MFPVLELLFTPSKEFVRQLKPDILLDLKEAFMMIRWIMNWGFVNV